MEKKPAEQLALAFGISSSAAREFVDRVQERLTRSVSNQFIVNLLLKMRTVGQAPTVKSAAEAVVAARPPGGEVGLKQMSSVRQPPAKAPSVPRPGVTLCGQ